LHLIFSICLNVLVSISWVPMSTCVWRILM
jgi:hypothetical protein